jgi:hypothetical protein
MAYGCNVIGNGVGSGAAPTIPDESIAIVATEAAAVSVRLLVAKARTPISTIV